MVKKKQQTDYSFGTSLRRAREKREYTREQIAERAGISPRFVSAIENDRRKPNLDVLMRLVHAIGTSFDEVLMPQTISEEYTADRIKRLITQCSQRDQELVLALIDQMLDSKEEKQ